MEVGELIDRISFIRNRANLSARKLSMLIGKTETYIHRMETTKGTQHQFAPTFESLMAILAACNTTPEEFFYSSIPQYKTDVELLSLFRNAPQERKQVCLDMLRVR